MLGYADGEPVGWCSIAPHETYDRLQWSRTIPKPEAEATWSVVCFFVDREVRGTDFTVKLLEAAVAYAIENGAEAVEGYPVAADARSYRFMGRVPHFDEAGFKDVTPKESKRIVMRYERDS